MPLVGDNAEQSKSARDARIVRAIAIVYGVVGLPYLLGGPIFCVAGVIGWTDSPLIAVAAILGGLFVTLFGLSGIVGAIGTIRRSPRLARLLYPAVIFNFLVFPAGTFLSYLMVRKFPHHLRGMTTSGSSGAAT